MTVFIAHAPADREAAEALARAVERRAKFVELEDGEQAFRPLQFSDSVVALVSKDSVFSPWRLRFEQRALAAWAEQKLILVKLDHHFAPVGLRDLPFVDASFEAQREFAWNEVLKRIDAQPKAPPPVAPSTPAPPAARPRADSGLFSQAEREARVSYEPPARKRGGALSTVLLVLLALPAAPALALIAAVWLPNRIGPQPGDVSDLVAGLNDFGARHGAPEGLTAPVAFGAVAVAVLALLVSLLRLVTRRGAESAEEEAVLAEVAHHDAAPEDEDEEDEDPVFVSYARVNSGAVLPVVEALKRGGRKLWLDREEIGGGEGWAGEIVRAIRSAQGVCVMCSTAAFESDHVKREVYLADRYKKRLVPVFLEAADPPEDFEYFFAGVQQVRLFETPEAERAAAVARALGAVNE